MDFLENLLRFFRLQAKPRGVTGRWTRWAIAHPVFGKIVMRRRKWQQAGLLLAHPVLGSQLRPWSTDWTKASSLAELLRVSYFNRLQ